MRAFASVFIVLAVLQASNGVAQPAAPVTRSQTINNDVRGMTTGVEKTFDPGDPLRVTGTLLDNLDNGLETDCFPGAPVTIATSSTVIIHPPSPPELFTGGDGLCSGGTSFSAGGTNASGVFNFVLEGGGVSWLTGPGLTQQGSWVEIEFRQGTSPHWSVVCADGVQYSHLPSPCANAPEIYGEVASPDLDGFGEVNETDLELMENLYLGRPVTLQSGWQANFNHVGPNVDASDLAYMFGRMGETCGTQKAGAQEYNMRVENLELEGVRAVMERHDISVAQIVQAWESMGLSYDRAAAARILTSDDTVHSGTSSWSLVKTLYR